jgi:hypothetical protein
VHLDAYLPRLQRLILLGRDLRSDLMADPGDAPTLAATRIWQRDSEALVGQLSGGSKAHWLSRAFSQAFLVRSTAHRTVGEAAPAEIVARIVDVLSQAVDALSQPDDRNGIGSPEPPHTHRFDFVRNAQLRPVLEQAFVDSRRAFENGDFPQALILSCSILEAILTDALQAGGSGLGPGGLGLEAGGLGLEAGGLRLEAGGLGLENWSFDARIRSAEQARLIRGGCARLPPAARQYRDLTDAAGDLRPDVTISEREARVAGQVLRVVMRDLDPGR